MPDEKPTGDEDRLREDLNAPLDDEKDDKTEDDKPTKESEEDLVAALKTELASQKSVNETQIADLRRSIGRVQSIAEKFAKDGTDSTTAVQSAITQEFGDVRDLLDAIVNSADETVFDTSLKAKIADARALAAQKANIDSLRSDLDAKFEDLKSASQVPDEETRTAAQALEASVVSEITDYGLDHKDFDWSEAATQFSSGGEPAVRKYFREQITEKLAEDNADARRQTKKESTEDSPAPSGPTMTDDDFLASDADLDAKVARLKQMGAMS